MQAEGCRPLRDVTPRSAMLLGALSLAGEAARLLVRIDRLFAADAADIVVPVDSPTFNFPLARRAKARGLPVVYYIAPQVWAWAEFRIRKVRARTDRLAVILPFEEAYFRSHGVDATFVGHPLIESLTATSPEAAAIRQLRSLGHPVVTCLPGSRRHVVDEVLTGQIEVCRRIRQSHPEAVFLFAAANPEIARRVQSSIASDSALAPCCTVRVNANAELISAADLALVASGTATLEVAYYRRPMIVMYNASRWAYRLLARWLIRTRHLSLVNILAGRRLVPEFMPYYRSTEPIAREALRLLGDEPRRQAIARNLDELIRSLGTRRASDEAARVVLETYEAHASRTAVPRHGPRGSRHRIW